MKSQILSILIGLMLGIAAGGYMVDLKHNENLKISVEHGRINTPEGVYYLQPVPDRDAWDQAMKDIARLNKSLNKKRR